MTDNQIAIILALILCAVTFCTLADFGVTWDEGEFYFSAGGSYYNWFRKPRLATIDKYWEQNHEQPPVPKVASGFSWYIFHKKLGLSKILSFRISILLFVFILLYILFRFSAQFFGRWIAGLVTIAFFTLPRIFFHSHLVAMDYPVTAMWLLCVYAYWRGTKEKRWIIYTAIFLGVALAVKITAFFIYVPIFLCWLLSGNKKRLFFWSIPLFIIPPLVFFLFWPWLWKDPVSRIWEYILFHKDHVFLRTHYFGKTYLKPPWHYPFVMTFFTIPVVVLVPFFIGIFSVFSRRFRKEKILILFNALLLLLIVALPTTPKYDGVRLFLPVFPFICILYGAGIYVLTSKLKWRKVFYWVYMPIFAFSIYSGVISYHPHQVVYYNELIGGIKGAFEKGMEMDYWAGSYKGILEWLNKQGKCRIYVFEDPYAFSWYHEDGMLSGDITLNRFGNSKYMVVLVRQGFFNEEVWDFFRNKTPAYSVKPKGVPLTCVYRINDEEDI